MTALSNQSFSHRIQGLVFGTKGLQELADKYAAHAEEEMGWVEKFANRILDLIGVQNWLVQKLSRAEASAE